MRNLLCISTFLLLLPGCLFSQEGMRDYEHNWHQWRGPSALGVAPAGDPPTEWNEDLNIKWKAEIPGIGHVTPIIWGNRIILLSAVQTDQEIKPDEPEKEGEQHSWMSPVKTNFIHEFVAISLDRRDGNIQWQTTLREELPHHQTHQFGSWASHSPVTDGVNIYAYFGSHGLYCLNMVMNIIVVRSLKGSSKFLPLRLA